MNSKLIAEFISEFIIEKPFIVCWSTYKKGLPVYIIKGMSWGWMPCLYLYHKPPAVDLHIIPNRNSHFGGPPVLTPRFSNREGW